MKSINEPTAAAISTATNHSGDKTVLVYDLGGGTVDVTVVKNKAAPSSNRNRW